MTQATLPNLNQTGVNEWSDVEGNDVALRNVINGQLQNDNLASNAAIAHSKLANATAGQLLIANASGVITATTMSGDATLSSSGALTIANQAVTNAKIADGTIQNTKLNLSANDVTQPNNINLLSTWSDLISITPNAGTYLFIGSLVAANFSTGIGANAAQVKFDSDASPRGSTLTTTSSQLLTVTVTVYKVITVDGSTPVKLQGQKQIAGGGASDIQSLGATPNGETCTRMLRIRIA